MADVDRMGSLCSRRLYNLVRSLRSRKFVNKIFPSQVVYKVSKNEGIRLELLITKIGVNETGYWIYKNIYQ
jgi:hypothetical protein